LGDVEAAVVCELFTPGRLLFLFDEVLAVEAKAAFFTEFSNIVKFFAFSLSYRDVSELLLFSLFSFWFCIFV